MHGLDLLLRRRPSKISRLERAQATLTHPHKACHVRTWQNGARTSAYVPSTFRPKQSEPKSRKLCANLGILPRQEHVDVKLLETVNGHVG